MSHSPFRSLASIALKFAISAGLIAFALRGVDFAIVLEHFRRVDAAPVVVAILATTAIALLHARRWEVVLARMEHALRYADALRLVLIGYFFNQTLPSTVGGDAYRIWGAYKHGIHAGNALASVMVDRVFALVALVAMILCGAWWLFDFVRTPVARWAVLLACAGGFAGFAVLLLLRRGEAVLGRWRATRLLLHVSDGARAVVGSPAAALEVLLLTVAGYMVLSCVVYVLAQEMGVALSLGHALLFVPLVTLVTILPVSIAGWGLRESAMVVSLGLIGVPSAQAFSISVLFGLVVMASGVPGGALWLLNRKRKPSAPPVEPHAQETP
jgi:uncharacterized membrane protein YbhN (UPF0104 family)